MDGTRLGITAFWIPNDRSLRHAAIFVAEGPIFTLYSQGPCVVDRILGGRIDHFLSYTCIDTGDCGLLVTIS